MNVFTAEKSGFEVQYIISFYIIYYTLVTGVTVYITFFSDEKYH